MYFISKEEFEKQSDKVKEGIMEWWAPRKENIGSFPLLYIHHLIEILENEYPDCKIVIDWSDQTGTCGGYLISLVEKGYDEKWHFEIVTSESEILNALWEAVKNILTYK